MTDNPVRRFATTYPFGFRTFIAILLVTECLFASIMIVDVATATHDPNDFFVQELTDGAGSFHAVHGSSPTEMWAAQDRGVSVGLWRNTGSGWSLHSSLTTGSAPTGLWVGSSTFAILTLGSGDVHDNAIWNGVSWTLRDDVGFTSGLHSPSGNSTTTGWVAENGNNAGFLCPFSASGVSSTTCFNFGIVTSRLNAEVAVSGASFGIATLSLNLGDAANVYTFNGAGWSFLTAIPNEIVLEAVLLSPTNGYLFGCQRGLVTVCQSTGSTGTVRRWNGVSLTAESAPANGEWYEGSAIAGNVWALGLAGTTGASVKARSPNDGTWTNEPVPPPSGGTDVFVPSNGLVRISQGNSIWVLQVNPSVALPSLANANFDHDDLHATVSHSQCLGDRISFQINVGPNLIGFSDLDAYIVNTRLNIVTEQIDDSQMNSLNGRYYTFNRTYPTDPYDMLVYLDTPVVSDSFTSEAFNVPSGSCYTPADAQTIQTQFGQTDANIALLQSDVDWINATTLRTESNVTQVNASVSDAHAHIDSHFVYQNTQANLTFANILAALSYQNLQLNVSVTSIQNQADTIHAHIDAHFSYTNLRLNETLSDGTFNVTVQQDVANQTVRLLANEFGLQLGETTTLNILIILAMVVIGVWLYRNKSHDLVLRTCGILIVLTAGVIALSVATAWTGGIVFAALVCFFAAGLMWVGALDYKRERSGKNRKGELEL